ncbi:ATP-binding protein [Mangrovibacillus cuniculi]|uniref:ATP-binding protein n=1 Tax=Mangrovibacillus cuniculi TaxID=2593652 RepID=A0A7S8CBU8_9BACI|nr:ATP-binding protein [Mangrovibacillus cuniculi]QPC47132.1 ATP-binding protein [Mangrovibacillus cuniculi]
MSKSIAEVLQQLQNRVQTHSLETELAGSNQRPDVNCTKCEDRLGFIYRNEDGIEVWRKCDCINQFRVRKLMKSSHITEEFKRLSFKSFITEGKPQIIQDAFECAMFYGRDFQEIRSLRGNSVALLGQPGAGKTHLLTALSNALMKRYHAPVLYFPFVEGFNDLRDDFNALEEKIGHMKRVDVLFIDDLFKSAAGKPRATDWTIEQMYAVINHRYLNHLPILISSELTIGEITSIDEALGSRIYEMCRSYMVLIRGDKKQLNHRLEGMFDDV